jgi:hypothetical protein
MADLCGRQRARSRSLRRASCWLGAKWDLAAAPSAHDAPVTAKILGAVIMHSLYGMK